MASKRQLLREQRDWAKSAGLEPDSRGYLGSVEANLMKRFDGRTRQAFEDGSGSELQDTESRPAKMRALHSSSALAVNVFDSWVDRDATPLRIALGIEAEIVSISFEAQFPTGLMGNPPNLDIALGLATGELIGIESKFSEWLTPKSRSKPPFKSKYFPEGPGLWEQQGLPGSQELAVAISEGQEEFRYLDAPQLLKHALGLATQLAGRFSLYYVYYDWPGNKSEQHRGEIDRLSQFVGDELGFKAISYQELFCSLAELGNVDSDYLGYLRDRYFRSSQLAARPPSPH